MNSLFLRAGLLSVIFTMLVVSVSAQGAIIRRLQERTEQKIINEVFGEPKQNQQNQQNNTGDDASTRVQNRRGTGLDQEAPDVNRHIREAGEAFEASNYILAKSSVRNALWGVELEIGKKVLESLPTSVEGLSVVQPSDRVSSAGAGFIGLIIERLYQGSGDRQLKTTIGNDAALLGLAGFYMVEGSYYQSTDEQNQKQIQFQNHRAVIKFDDYEGYTLSVPFGQSSVFVLVGANFDNESQFMAAANRFDINTIKNQLGEQ